MDVWEEKIFFPFKCQKAQVWENTDFFLVKWGNSTEAAVSFLKDHAPTLLCNSLEATGKPVLAHFFKNNNKKALLAHEPMEALIEINRKI